MSQDSQAKFKVEMKIEGMTDGMGDRSAGFEVNIPPDDVEAANEIWYKHFALLFGAPEGGAKLQEMADELVKKYKK
jgi:hypothetical protein